MRRVNQAELLQIRHHVADRGRRQRHRDQARDVARSHRLAGGEVTLDDLTKDVPRPLIELGEPGMRRDQANRIVVGHRQLRSAGAALATALICRSRGPVTSRHWACAVARRASKGLAAAPSPSYKHREPSLLLKFWRI